MYEHVISIISLNSTLRSSNPEVRVLDSGLRVLEFACSQGGKRGSNPDPLPVIWPGNIPRGASLLIINEVGILRKLR